MNHYQFEDLISAYIENELSIKKRKQFEKYLLDNPNSKNLVDSIKTNIKEFQKLPSLKASQEFNNNLLKKVKANDYNNILKIKSKNTIFGFSLLNAIVMICLVCIFFILSIEVIQPLPDFQKNTIPKFVDNKGNNKKREIFKDPTNVAMPAPNLANTLTDTARQTKKDFSDKIKFVND